MKNTVLILLIAVLTVTGCRGENADDIQRIDQMVNIYIDSLGQDMLNSNIPGSYFSVTMNDVEGLTDNAPVTVNFKKDSDTVSYIRYIAGARRIPVGISVDNADLYRSTIALTLRRQLNDSMQAVTNDTLTLNYTYTPQLFQISSARYNDVPVFTKIEGQPNVIKISK